MLLKSFKATGDLRVECGPQELCKGNGPRLERAALGWLALTSCTTSQIGRLATVVRVTVRDGQINMHLQTLKHPEAVPACRLAPGRAVSVPLTASKR
jgi:hypothetical protein